MINKYVLYKKPLLIPGSKSGVSPEIREDPTEIQN